MNLNVAFGMIRMACLWGGLAICGCPSNSDPQPSPTDAGAQQPVDPGAFQRKAHAAALERLVPLATEAFKVADPLAAEQIGLSVLAPAPIGRKQNKALGAALDRARAEATDIHLELLGLRERVVLYAVRFGLERIEARVDNAHGAWRRDPGFVLRELEPVLEALETLASRGEFSTIPQTITKAAQAVRAAKTELAAMSGAAADAARQDIAALRVRTDRLRTLDATLQPGCADLHLALKEFDQWLHTAQATFDTAAQVSWSVPLPNRAKSPDKIRRLPDRIDPPTLKARLHLQEDLDKSPQTLFSALGPTMARIEAMTKKLPPNVDEAAASSVDVARCQRTWDSIAAWLETQPSLKAAQLDCMHAAQRLEGHAQTDGQLALSLIDWGVVEPTRRVRRTEELPAIALVSGRMAPWAQRNVLSIAVAAGSGRVEAQRLALTRARDRLCISAAALWIFGALGSDDELSRRLERRCPQRTTAWWIDAAERRPVEALDGVGLLRVGTGPADVVALHRFWWSPFGLIAKLANPEVLASRPSPVNVNVEQLDSKSVETPP